MTEISAHYNLRRKILINLVFSGGLLVSVIVNSSFMKFFTDVIGISPALYGVVFLIFSIWNGINDPIIGYWADRQPFKTGKGKYLPLIRWSIPIIGIPVIALLFTSPQWNDLLTVLFLLFLMVIYEGGQTLLNVSFMAFTVNTFLSTDERTQITVIGGYLNQIPAFLGGMIPIWFFTGDFSRPQLIAIFSGAILLGLVLVWIGQLFVREDEKFYEHMEVTRGLKELLSLSRHLFTEKVFVIFILAFFFISAATGAYFTGYIYYMDNVLEVSGLKATVPDILTGIFQMAFFPVVVWLVKRYGAKKTLWRGLLIAATGHAVLALPVNYWVVAVTYIVILIGYGFDGAIRNPLTGLIVDHIELKTGKRQPGVVRGIMAVLLIPAASFQPLILSWLLTAAGYVGSSKHQTAEVIQAIRLGVGLVPAIMLVVGIALLVLLPLNFQQEQEIQAAMEEKHGQKPETAIR
jgi:GPH family glycoside/pentoside/hexuronide:cation symporter